MTLIGACALLAGCGGAAAAGRGVAADRIDIQAVFDKAGNPVMVANPNFVRRRLAEPRWKACPGRHVVSCEPGPTPPGTVFEARATYGGKTYVGRTPPWRGTVRATSPPLLEGEPRAGAKVTPVAGRWAGGWGGELDRVRVQACRTADARSCVNLSPQDGGPAVVRARYAGRYLFAFDERLARDTVFAEPGYGSPEAVPPLDEGPTVSRSTPAGPVSPSSTDGCPRRMPPRSSPTVGTRFAPGRPSAERFCIYRAHGHRLYAQREYHSGALRHALNRSRRRPPPDYLCPAYAGLPSVVVLDYATHTRRVVLQTGGCPAIVVRPGRYRPLVRRAAGTVQRFYVRTAGER